MIADHYDHHNAAVRSAKKQEHRDVVSVSVRRAYVAIESQHSDHFSAACTFIRHARQTHVTVTATQR